MVEDVVTTGGSTLAAIAGAAGGWTRDLWRRQRARPARRRRRGDRARGRRALRRAHHDRRDLPGAPRPRGRLTRVAEDEHAQRAASDPRRATPARCAAAARLFRRAGRVRAARARAAGDRGASARGAVRRAPRRRGADRRARRGDRRLCALLPTFSTLPRRSRAIWLEDLYVRPEHRGGGVGRALLAAVAARVRERGGERLEWSALDWNELALGFYRGLGARDDERVDHAPADRRGPRAAGRASPAQGPSAGAR